MDKQATATKMTWFVIFFAILASVGVYALMCFIIQQSRSEPPETSLAVLRPICYALAGVSLLASIVWMHLKMRGKSRLVGEPSQPLSPGEFQTVTIQALAMADVCAPFGLLLFFMGAPIAEFALFAIATVVVMLVFILPKGISYWAAWEGQQKQ
jgi:hypothetical protein